MEKILFFSVKKVSLFLFMFFMFALSSFGQDVAVKGQVKDQNTGEPLIGADVMVKGTSRGVITDADGNFTLEVPFKSVLVITYLGYATLEVPVDPSRAMTILMKEDTKLLDEVVVIGYGQVRKRDATGAVISVNPDEMNKGITTSPQDLLAGKVAGVSVISDGGQPGGKSTIRIRGGSSLTANNDPLVVIDGVIMNTKDLAGMSNPLNAVNPNDIESFSVLKDASATAIYGSRAANGVILITTKKGSSGTLSVNYSGSMTVSTPRDKIDVLNADQYRDLITLNPITTDAMITALNMYPDTSTDWQDVIFQTSLSTDHSLSLLGTAGDFMPYRISLGYTNNEGILKTSNFKRYSGDISLNPSFFDKHLNINLNAKGAYIKNKFADTGSLGAAIAFDPTKPVKNDNYKYGGFYTWTTDGTPNGTKTGSSTTNPASLLGMTDDHSTVKTFVGSARFDYKLHFFPDLKLFLNLSTDYGTSDGQKYIRPDAPSNYGTDPLRTGRNETYTETNKNNLLEFYGQYMKDVESIESHFDVMGGYSYQAITNEKDQTNYFLSRNETNFGENTEIDGQPTSVGSKSVLISFFGRFNYSFKDRYLLTFTLRDDATSRFSKDNRWGLFPSVALGWRLNEESFLKDYESLSNLKLRLGWGVTGQQYLSNDAYPYLSYVKMGRGGAYFPMFNPATGLIEYVNVAAITASNPNLKWEETTTWNVGLDYGFLNNRINGSLDLYYKKTDDLLNDKINKPAGTDFAEYVLSNIGSMENKGVEFSIDATPVVTDDFTWNVGFNIAYNKSKITALTANDATTTSPGYQFESTGGDGGKSIKIHSVGYAPGTYYVYQQIYDTNGKPIEGAYVDKNGDGAINSDDLFHYKKPTANVLMGFSTKVIYKNWDLGFNGRSSIGNYNYNSYAANNAALNVTGLFGNNFLSNRPLSALETNFQERQRQSSYYVQNASFVKIDNITLGYSFKNLGSREIGSLRVYATVQNPVVITKYKGLDPEVENGMDNNLYPRPLAFIFGVNMSF